MARLERIQPPPQFTLGFTELEWLGYKAWYREGVARGQLVPEAMEQQGAAQCSTDAGCSTKGARCVNTGPIGGLAGGLSASEQSLHPCAGA
jgi:hypothetical protein